MQNKILITGGNGGFGELITQKLLLDGHLLVVSMRDISGRNARKAEALKAAGALVVEIDVTNDNSVISGVNQAIEQANGLDVVINNAGIGAFGIQESFTDQDWRKIFEVNVFGVQRVNRAVLPQFRQQNQGLLIHISSLIGRMVLPFWGAYSASKWALEALAEGYNVELSEYNIDSCIVEPGPYATDFFADLVKPSDKSCVASYGDVEQHAQAFFTRFGDALVANTQQKASLVAETVAELVKTPLGQRSLRTVADNMGIGEPVEQYNRHHETMTSTVFHELGI